MIYDRLKKICKAKGTNPTALCKKISISTGNIITWKNGNAKDEHLVEIAKELEIGKHMCYKSGQTLNKSYMAKNHLYQTYVI